MMLLISSLLLWLFIVAAVDIAAAVAYEVICLLASVSMLQWQ